jgi:ATP-binding cassette subfamily F protein uup
MALLLTLKDISVAFGGPKILDHVTLNVGERERIALMGRNGEGKSTLMKVVSGVLQADDGEIIRHKQKLRISFMIQEVPEDSPQTARELVLSAFDGIDDGQLLSDKDHHWEIEHKAEKVLTQVGIDPDAIFATLSGGQRRRVLLARALVIEPDVLLLDEPTNHMDLDTIVWMEEKLLSFTGSVMFVTHDRYFLKKIATKIVELDRGMAFAWDCGYDDFLERKDAWLEAEEKRNAAFDKKLAQEEAWIRQGIQARRTRNEGRVRALMKMRAERLARRSRTGKARMAVAEAEESGRLIFKIHNLGFSYPDKKIVEKFTNVIMRGDRIAVMGANGCGKSTFLRLLLGKLAPQIGTVKIGANLEIAYFDQCREGLNENETVVQNVSGGATYMRINDRDVHVYGYLRRFLFPIDRADTPVKALSGGEKNRLLLAKLFAHPSNVLVLDEPTNDLDMQTLDLLEELLTQYEGTIILVTHDRDFINNVATSTFV